MDFDSPCKDLLFLQGPNLVQKPLYSVGTVLKGCGIWKMNVSPLEDGNYLDDLKNKFPQWKTMGANDLSD